MGCGFNVKGNCLQQRGLWPDCEAMREANFSIDERLLVLGDHRHKNGAIMQWILTSNNLSCLGVIDVLNASERRMPNEVTLSALTIFSMPSPFPLP